MLLREVEYIKPETLTEALSVLKARQDARCLAGGQTLVNIMKLRLASPGVVVDLNSLSELRVIRLDGEFVRIGAMTTYRSITESELIQRYLPIASEVAGHIADRQVRNRGTIGGNCCFNDPTSNFPPLLSVLDAKFEVLGSSGSKIFNVDDFFLGPYQTAVRQSEILSALLIPIPPRGSGTSYLSLRVGNDGPAILHVSAYVEVNDTPLKNCKVAIGCVHDAPYRPVALEEKLVTSLTDVNQLSEVINIGLQGLQGIADVHASAKYRTEMAKVYVRRSLVEALEKARKDEHNEWNC